ncbi:hypothetical protein RM780_12370 [Streptomyces sp. DSM 44917]|uniref:DUF6542 domain-containing protein n=1 Tax=Streptomyces boetiae TaxID=3075541 RepID=A0ABU2L8D4_9ACTN|nr:DUF6542 domain-containing protein [Streptomyces sp. DSM 44917]MDT0307752.1 hypothetical protein [Streptomyces sp. DSM 44917]
MEHSTHTIRHPRLSSAGVRTRVPRPAGPPAARAGARRRRRLPRPRLTGLGCGVLALAGMVSWARLCELLGGVPALYGTLFVATAGATALWVRPADLICAPIAAPIAFAAGLITTEGLVATVTELALRAPWLFAGTLLATLIALARKALVLLRRRLAGARRAANAGRTARRRPS